MGDRQHYVSAALLGGFGRPHPTRKGGRYASIAVRDLATGELRISTAENEAHRRALYSLTAPPPDVDRDIVDKLWAPIEPGLPALVKRVEGRALTAGDDARLLDYAASVWVRHPSFSKVAEHHQSSRGVPAPGEDEVQVMRVEALLNQRRAITFWRWRVLHGCAEAARFVISDLGWIGIADTPGGDPAAERINAAFVPLSPRVGLLAYADHPRLPPRQPPFAEHRDVVPSWVAWLNACATSTGRGTLIEPRQVFGHPDDADAVRALPGADKISPNPGGPFRGTGLSAATLFD